MYLDDDNTPETPGTVKLPELNREDMRRWLAALPVSESEAAGALYRALAAVQEHAALAPALRFDLIELLRAPLMQMAERLRARLSDSALPGNDQLESILLQGRSVHHQLLQAYLTCARAKNLGDRLLSFLFYRSLQHSGHLLLWQSQRYRRPERQFWRSIYKLYWLCEARDLLRARIEDPAESEFCRMPESQFKRAVLLYLADPRRMRLLDMFRLFQQLGKLAHQAEVWTQPIQDGNLAQFAILLDLDRAPVPLTLLPGGEANSHRRFLATTRLVLSLREIEATAQGRPGRADLDKATLTRVINRLSNFEKRRTSRMMEDRDCQFVFGLTAVIGSLSSAEGTNQTQAPMSLDLVPMDSAGSSLGARLNKPAPDLNLVPRHDVANDRNVDLELEMTPVPRGGWDIPSERIWHMNHRAVRPIEPLTGHLLDSGSLGFRIDWTSRPTPQLRVGELVGLLLDSHLFIGVIRWLEARDDALRFGAELLAPRAITVDLADSSGRPRGLGLMLPADRLLRQHPEVLIPPGTAQPGSILILRSSAESGHYKIRDLIESTGSFDRCTISHLQSRL